MDVNTITISRNEALTKLSQYKALNARQRTAVDDRIQSMYSKVSDGARVINVANAFRETGLNDKGQPKLAIARGDWREVYFHPKRWLRIENDGNIGGTTGWRGQDGAGAFNDTDQFRWMAYSKTVSFADAFPTTGMAESTIRAAVPHVPPSIRPATNLRNFHILFEVSEWVLVTARPKYSRDPFLLQRISGDLFIVVAEWELTELEASLLSSLVGN